MHLASVRNAALYPAWTTTIPASVVDSAAPIPCAVMIAPCATLKRPVPHVRWQRSPESRGVDARTNFRRITERLRANNASDRDSHEPWNQERIDHGLRPHASAFAPTSIAMGTITICAATMQADMRLVPRLLLLKRELLAEPQQHRRVCEVNVNRETGEHQERAGGSEKHGQPSRAIVSRRFGVV